MLFRVFVYEQPMGFPTKYLALAIVIIVLSVFFVNPAHATAISFTVPAGQDVTKTIDLQTEDRVTIKFTVTGQASNVIDFYILDPAGTIMQTFNGTGNVNYSFICSKEGTYELHFSNVGSSEDKLVSLDYEAEHYILGMPQMLFLTLVVVGICLVMIAVFFLMGKPR
jgi:hypothetical protein